MVKLELLVNDSKVEEVKLLLREIGIKKISLIEVEEYDEDNIHEEGYRGSTFIVDVIKRVKIELLLNSEERVDRTLHMLSLANIDTEVLLYEVKQSYLITKRQ